MLHLSEFLEFCQTDAFQAADDEQGIYWTGYSLRIGYNKHIDPPEYTYLTTVGKVRSALLSAHSLVTKPAVLRTG